MGDNCSVSVSSQAGVGRRFPWDGHSGWSLLVMATPGGTSTRHTAGETSLIISGKDMHFKTQFCVKMYYLRGNNHMLPCSMEILYMEARVSETTIGRQH